MSIKEELDKMSEEEFANFLEEFNFYMENPEKNPLHDPNKILDPGIIFEVSSEEK